MELPLVAGMVSTALFGISNLPMVLKAVHTKDLGSYSLGSLALINAANGVHSLYVFTLPMGPIWLLHSFYLVASALMLVMFLRYQHAHGAARSSHPEQNRRQGHGTPAVAPVVGIG
jgi:uncharacterized protein with PQ loop repeat